MKKLFYFFALMLTTVGFTACGDDDDEKAPIIVSFSQDQYSLGGQIGDKVVITANASAPFEKATTVTLGINSFVFSGGASLNPLEVTPGYAFEFAAGSTTATITITRKTLGSGSLSVSLTPNASFKVGTTPTAEVTFLGANVYSFDTDTDVLADTREYKVTLETADGKPFSFATDTEIPVVLSPKTTAVAGVNYEFVGGNVAKFQAGKSEGTVTIKFLKYEEGKDKLLIALDNTNLRRGNYGYLTIYITGTPNFAGEWQYAGIWKKNADWWANSWTVDAEALALIVDGSSSDSFKFEVGDGGYQFTPNFAGKLKNYFTKATKAAYIGARDERMQELASMNPPTWQMFRYEFDEVNKAMSATDNKAAKGRVGFFFATDDDTNKEYLIMTIYDYEPTDATVFGYYSWKDVYDSMAYSTPIETVMEAAPIRVAFTRK
jgi:hypothetical protein